MKLADPRPLLLLLSFCWMAAVQPVQGQVTQPLTAGESRCEAKRMYAATLQSWAWPRDLSFPESREARLTLSPAGPAGGIQGVAYLDQFTFAIGTLASTPEELLWFTLGQTAPNRPQNVRLARTAETVLVDPDYVFSMAFVHGPFEAAVAGDWNALLDVDNIEPPEGAAVDFKRLPQLAEALRPCHARHTAADLRVFSLLQRILRVQTHPVHPNFYLQSHKMVIYRGRTAEPIAGGVRTSYRVDVYPWYEQFRLALEILIDIDEQGRPGNATAYPLRDCNSPLEQVHCNNGWGEVYIIKPVAPGQFYDFDQTVGFCVDSFCANRGSFNFAERLAGTPWALTD